LRSLTAVAVFFNLPGNLNLVLRLFLALGLALAKLLLQLVNGQVDGGVEIILGILGMKIGPRNSQVNLDLVIFFLRAVLVVEKNDVRGQDFPADFLKVGNLGGYMGMDGGCELKMTGAEMDLHRFLDTF